MVKVKCLGSTCACARDWLALTAILTARDGGNAEVRMCMVLASVSEYAERE